MSKHTKSQALGFQILSRPKSFIRNYLTLKDCKRLIRWRIDAKKNKGIQIKKS